MFLSLDFYVLCGLLCPLDGKFLAWIRVGVSGGASRSNRLSARPAHVTGSKHSPASGTSGFHSFVITNGAALRYMLEYFHFLPSRDTTIQC